MGGAAPVNGAHEEVPKSYQNTSSSSSRIRQIFQAPEPPQRPLPPAGNPDRTERRVIATIARSCRSPIASTPCSSTSAACSTSPTTSASPTRWRAPASTVDPEHLDRAHYAGREGAHRVPRGRPRDLARVQPRLRARARCRRPGGGGRAGAALGVHHRRRVDPHHRRVAGGAARHRRDRRRDRDRLERRRLGRGAARGRRHLPGRSRARA